MVDDLVKLLYGTVEQYDMVLLNYQTQGACKMLFFSVALSLFRICKHHKSSPLSVRKGSIFARSHTPLAKWLEFILR